MSDVRQVTRRLLGENGLVDAVRTAYQALADLGLVTTKRMVTSCG